MSLLSINNLHASVEDHEILKGLSLDVNAGEVHAIMGPNGSGKSTLAGVLAGRDDYEISEGSVTFDGEDITRLNALQMRRYRTRMQMIFQDPYSSINPRTSSMLLLNTYRSE